MLVYDGSRGALYKVLYGEALPRDPTPYLFVYHFDCKGTTFVCVLLQKDTPFTDLIN